MVTLNPYSGYNYIHKDCKAQSYSLFRLLYELPSPEQIWKLQVALS